MTEPFCACCVDTKPLLAEIIRAYLDPVMAGCAPADCPATRSCGMSRSSMFRMTLTGRTHRAGRPEKFGSGLGAERAAHVKNPRR